MAASSNIICFTCSTCDIHKYSMQKYLDHLYIMYEHTAGYLAVCNIDGCPVSYKSVKCLRQHIRIKHTTIYYSYILSTNFCNTSTAEILENEYLENCDDQNNGYECDNATISCFHSESESDSPDLSMSLDKLLGTLQQHFGLFIVGIAEKHSVPSVVQIDLANEVQSLLTYYNNNFCSIIKQELGNSLVSNENLQNLLNNELILDKVLSVVNSSKKIIAFSKTNLGLILPLEINLCIKDNILDENDFCVESIVIDHQNGLPKSAIILIEKEEIWNSIKRKLENDLSAKTNLLYSYSDGFICKHHNIFNNKYALRLHLYIDEIEVCNPIGAHRKVHKICAFYFFLGNIEDKYISRLQNMYLCILVKEKLIKEHKTNKDVLKPFIQDLKTLQNEGILVMVDGQQIRLYGGLATISADNLSAHALAGFRRVFNSGFFCRQCMSSYINKTKIFSELDATLRTNEIHQYHLTASSGHGQISSSMYGVERRCPFLDLSYFKVMQSFLPDIMHDMLEGTIPRLISLLLLKLKGDKLIEIDQVNIELNIFEIGRNDRLNKPVPFVVRSATSINFIGSASFRFMFRLLPFMIGNRIPMSNKYWLLYLQLREIADYVFAPKISKSVLTFLQFLVEQFLHNFAELFPDNFTPKFHFMLHYARLINDYGPLRYLWCMRFEAKHFLAASIQEKLVSFFGYSMTDKKETIWKCSSLLINGTQFHVHDTVILALLHVEEIPLFFKIYHIIRFRHHWVFCEEEIDGKTLVSLTETMVASLCQTIGRQVVLIEIIRHLITSHDQQESS
ncbi:uncharacterized protein LOC136080144 [Hydra vulgaris]|uniref:Uncharacterized protein LOC136080144 n=1 Tax=Hydra vulgaris TaxID=6087 RepID=A0ABM4BUI7_HYDVU